MERADQADLIRWRDLLDSLTSTQVLCDVNRGLQLARQSQHPDAQWLCSLFPGVEDRTNEELLRVMKTQGVDRRALYVRSRRSETTLLRRAAELGYAPAQARWSSYCSGAERLEWAQKAAAQGDRAGVSALATCFWFSVGCEEDKTKARALWREAAELGEVSAQFVHGAEGCTQNDWQRYRWWGMAAARGENVAGQEMVGATSEQLQWWEEGACDGRVVFELGAAFRGHVDVMAGTCFGFSVDSNDDLKAVQRCIELLNEWVALSKSAIETWIGIARRLHVVKDIRLMIAWLLRAEPWAWSKVQVDSACVEKEEERVA